MVMLGRSNTKNGCKCLPNPFSSANSQSLAAKWTIKKRYRLLSLSPLQIDSFDLVGSVSACDKYPNKGIMWCQASNIAIILAIYLVCRSNNTFTKCVDKFYLKFVLVSKIKHGVCVCTIRCICVCNSGQSRKMTEKTLEKIYACF